MLITQCCTCLLNVSLLLRWPKLFENIKINLTKYGFNLQWNTFIQLTKLGHTE